MLRLRFHGVLPGDTPGLQPAPWIRISGNFLRVGPGGEICATLHQHSWAYRDHHYTRWEIEGGACTIHFEDVAGGRAHGAGPLKQLSGVDGVLRGGDRLLAKFIEETQLWHAFESETYWPVLIIEPTRPA